LLFTNELIKDFETIKQHQKFKDELEPKLKIKLNETELTLKETNLKYEVLLKDFQA